MVLTPCHRFFMFRFFNILEITSFLTDFVNLGFIKLGLAKLGFVKLGFVKLSFLKLGFL
jgi:hypothetical protein